MKELFNYSQRQLGFRNVGNISARQRNDKILFGGAVCKSCFTSILYKAKIGDDTNFYGTKNLSDHLKICRRTPSFPSISNHFESKQGKKQVYFESSFLSFDFSQLTYWVQGQGSFGSHGSRVNKSDPVSSLVRSFRKNGCSFEKNVFLFKMATG